MIAESPSASEQKIHRIPGNFGTTRHFNGIAFQPSTKHPYYYKKENKTQDKTFPAVGVHYTTTVYQVQNQAVAIKKQESTTLSVKDKGYENRRIPDYEDISDTSILKLMNSLLESHLGNDDGSPTESSWGLDLLNTLLKESFDNQTTTSSASTVAETESTPSTTESFNSDYTFSTMETTYDFNSTILEGNTESTTETLKQVTFKNVLNTTDCIENEINDVEHRQIATSIVGGSGTVGTVDANEGNTSQQEVTSASSAETSTERDVTEVDLEYKVDVAKITQKPLSTIELLRNLTKIKEEGLDYDYNDLPPSLPNLR